MLAIRWTIFRDVSESYRTWKITAAILSDLVRDRILTGFWGPFLGDRQEYIGLELAWYNSRYYNGPWCSYFNTRLLYLLCWIIIHHVSTNFRWLQINSNCFYSEFISNWSSTIHTTSSPCQEQKTSEYNQTRFFFLFCLIFVFDRRIWDDCCGSLI